MEFEAHRGGQARRFDSDAEDELDIDVENHLEEQHHHHD